MTGEFVAWHEKLVTEAPGWSGWPRRKAAASGNPGELFGTVVHTQSTRYTTATSLGNNQLRICPVNGGLVEDEGMTLIDWFDLGDMESGMNTYGSMVHNGEWTHKPWSQIFG